MGCAHSLSPAEKAMPEDPGVLSRPYAGCISLQDKLAVPINELLLMAAMQKFPQ